ncbi:MAG: MBL fold metallo-hydrolase [Pseudomonadota bacterium]|uniref:MBL fold metallo-hydrolase n=1 Tax=Thermithiobacillus tepidarius TaxID=929 RepID=UPI0003FEB4A7|nr:MBL fold metallo-hydrolase [Thermithiobacillus tepidarius]
MIFRQLFDPTTSTLTYLLGDEATRQAVLIDSVLEQVDRDLALLQELGLTLAYTLETHIHADHVSGAKRLRELTGCKISVPDPAKLDCADLLVREGEPLQLGSLRIEPLHTPGHTDVDFCYRVGDRVFTGDTLLIDGCGRTDFQSGDAAALYRSVQDKLFTLPGETLVYPGHDYNHRRVSSIEQERLRNPRLGGGKTLDEFVAIMDNLNLPKPAQIERAVPANLGCGRAAAGA